MFREEVAKWTHGSDWRTWVAHSVIAVLLAVPGGLVGHVIAAELGMLLVGTAAPISYYAIREAEQILYGYIERKPDVDWFDHFMDVAAPTVTVIPILWTIYKAI